MSAFKVEASEYCARNDFEMKHDYVLNGIAYNPDNQM